MILSAANDVNLGQILNVMFPAELFSSQFGPLKPISHTLIRKNNKIRDESGLALSCLHPLTFPH